MIQTILNLFFGCRHPDLSRVFKGRDVPFKKMESYVVCLTCGSAFAYDWKTMKIGHRVAVPEPETWQDIAARQGANE
jgi:hypothetical protein